jgi:hypothetical protein
MPGDDFDDGSLADAELRHEGLEGIVTGGMQAAEKSDVGVGELGTAVAFGGRTSAVTSNVCRVLTVGAPAKVCQSIVPGVAVEVPCPHAGRTGADEGSQDKGVYTECAVASRVVEVDGGIGGLAGRVGMQTVTGPRKRSAVVTHRPDGAIIPDVVAGVAEKV